MELALSAQELDERRLITGTKGPGYTHIPLGAEAGLTEYAESYANATDLHTIPKPGSTATRAAWPATSRPHLPGAMTCRRRPPLLTRPVKPPRAEPPCRRGRH